MKKLISGIVFCMIFSPAIFAGKVNFYVSPSGNNQNPGTKERPVSTLSAVRDLVRQYKSTHEFPVEGITIWVSGGTYYQEEPLVFNETDSGISGSPVVWRAVEGEKVNINWRNRHPR